ncbi:PEP/pyruvate-binding domain-containing protein [Cellulomonas cellasea]|uniref:PEP/pyruvate-binding domain-containing protein n=1 Tax=Cellulomonas cellasea TaxID=43670 RepID=UPI0025A3F93A|nr:PEP/pyruvate-binding domain-containing protein [Cellulomonas cellasea]MDM8084408.1 PEP/pyruvate-binding domain-containing protein [Cellulomonas cellasea]
MSGIVPLAESGERCGRKAATLGRLMREGFAVPRGFVVANPGDSRWRRGLGQALAGLRPGPYAVRSSGLGEDGLTASFAGQFHTTLNVPAAGVADAILWSAASGSTVAARAYASRLGQAVADVAPVLVQQMVQPDVAGVLFTRHPVTGADQVVIEAVDGLGDRLVNGEVTPGRWIVGEHGIVEAPRSGALLTEQQVGDLVRLGWQIEARLGAPQDIEWAIERTQVWVLQSRPITPSGGSRADDERPVADPILSGIAASPGLATGRVSVVRGLDDFAEFREGDVLVCRATSPAWTPVLARAAAVVTETGGLLSHAAIVAREFGVPAVVSADDATALLAGHATVLVDGNHGTVAQPFERPTCD